MIRRNPVTGRAIGQDWWAARYTDHEIELVWALRSEGFSVRAISERLDMPRSTVADVVSCRRGGVALKGTAAGKRGGRNFRRLKEGDHGED